jgi:hypothetical protein
MTARQFRVWAEWLIIALLVIAAIVVVVREPGRCGAAIIDDPWSNILTIMLRRARRGDLPLSAGFTEKLHHEARLGASPPKRICCFMVRVAPRQRDAGTSPAMAAGSKAGYGRWRTWLGGSMPARRYVSGETLVGA